MNDIMDFRAAQAFRNLRNRGFLSVISSPAAGGAVLYRDSRIRSPAGLGRDEQIVLNLLYWPAAYAEVVRKAAAKFRLSNAVRWPMAGGRPSPLRILTE